MYKFEQHRFLSLIMLFALGLMLTGCGGDAAQPTPTSVAQPTPTTVTAAQPTDTAAVTAAQPTDTVSIRGNAGSDPATPAEDTPADAPTAATGGSDGTAVADLGFRAQPNGFSFPNYSGKYPETPGNLTVEDLRKIFGDQAVCATGSGETCNPAPGALSWLDQQNKSLNGGSCEGFAVATLQMFEGKVNPAEYGGTTPFDLKLEGNDRLRSLISRGAVYQYIEPVAGAAAVTRQKSPADILDLLIESFKPGSSDQYTLGFYSPHGGHAVVPFAVEDKGNGQFWIMVYDNNYPGENKYVEVDRNANTWKYSVAALNPSEDAAPWSGGVGSYPMDLTSLAVRSGPLVCPWCDNAGGGVSQPRQVALNGPGNVLITDSEGHQLGMVDGKLVNNIPGAYAVIGHGAIFSNHEPYYNLPTGVDYDITILDEAGNEAADEQDELSIFGQGMVVQVDDIKLDEGQSDHLTLSGNGGKVSYKPGAEENPTFIVIVDGNDGHDYQMKFSGLDVGSGEEIDFFIDETTGKLGVKDASGEAADIYDLELIEVDDTGSHSFTHKDLSITGGDTEYLDFDDWDEGESLNIEVDEGSDGDVDSSEETTDSE